MRKPILFFCVLVSMSNNIEAQPSYLDPSFNITGKVVNQISLGNDFATGVVIDTLGKILVAGGVESNFQGGFNFVVARYNSNGQIDNSFGNLGLMITDIQGNDTASAIALQPDGKILVAGSSNGGFTVVRYNTNGTLDNSFGISGKSIIRQGHLTGMHLNSNGKIILTGDTTINYTSPSRTSKTFCVVRLNANGTIDNSFGQSGVSTFDFMQQTIQLYSTDKYNCFPAASVIQNDEKVILVGTYNYNATNNDFVTVRFKSNGSIDSTFGSNGVVITELGSLTDDHATAVSMADGGKIIVCGTSQMSTNMGAVVRYNSDGSLDNTFDQGGNSDGIALLPFLFINSCLVQADDKILIGGHTCCPDPFWESKFQLGRFDSKGIIDSSFGNSGFIITGDFIGGGNEDDNVLDLALQKDGKVIAVGYANKNYTTEKYTDFALARYFASNSSTSLAENFIDKTKLAVYPNPSTGLVSIYYRKAFEEAIFSIYNALGQKITEQIISASTDEIHETLDLSALTCGIYFLQITDGYLVTQKKVIIK